MLQTGIKGKKEITVTLDKTAKAMGSGTMDVFATPAMIALMENTAFESVAPELEEGSGTVGTALDIKHVSATPVSYTHLDVYKRQVLYKLVVGI